MARGVGGPKLKVLLTSGYTENSIVHQGQARSGRALPVEAVPAPNLPSRSERWTRRSDGRARPRSGNMPVIVRYFRKYSLQAGTSDDIVWTFNSTFPDWSYHGLSPASPTPAPFRALDALAHDTRLKVHRLLVQAGQDRTLRRLHRSQARAAGVGRCRFTSCTCRPAELVTQRRAGAR